MQKMSANLIFWYVHIPYNTVIWHVIIPCNRPKSALRHVNKGLVSVPAVFMEFIAIFSAVLSLFVAPFCKDVPTGNIDERQKMKWNGHFLLSVPKMPIVFFLY